MPNGLINPTMGSNPVKAAMPTRYGRPDFQLVLIGRLAVGSARSLPRRSNIHWLGPKAYKDLPRYIAGWDAGMLPLSRATSARVASPAKAPEYLAAGKPVVSTPAAGVMGPYGEQGLVYVADKPETFLWAIEAALLEDPARREARVSGILDQMCWDTTWARMDHLIDLAAFHDRAGAGAPSGAKTPNTDRTHTMAQGSDARVRAGMH